VAHPELLRALIQYHDAGAYERDQAIIGRQALDYLKSLPANRKKRAVVLDIDETSLSNNWPSLVDPVNGYNKQAWDRWIESAKAPAVKPTLTLFHAARERDIEVFFITGRPEKEREATERNLRHAGYDGWTQIFMEPTQPGSTLLVFPEAAAYKTAARWSITDRGFQIVLNFGDQRSDLEGGYADKTFQLPNPFYTVI
jgi:predicted secreted acid phosphatase